MCCENPGVEDPDQLVNSVASRDSRIVVLDPELDLDEAVQVMTSSFAGTPLSGPEGTTDWILGPKLRAKQDDPQRAKSLSYMMKWCFLVSAHYGLNLGLRDATTKKLMAVLVTRPPGTIKNGNVNAYCVAWNTSIRLKGQAPWDNDVEYGYGVEMRSEGFLTAIQKSHKEKAGTEDHWYVSCMAVAPEYQGMGCCRALMHLVHVLADRNQHKCLVETMGKRNAAVYQKFGYTEQTPYTMHDLTREEKDCELLAMVRPPQPPRAVDYPLKGQPVME